MSFIAAAVIGAGASLLGARAQSKAAGRASDVSAAQYQQTREDLDPWRQTGQLALSDLSYRMGLTPGGGTSRVAPTREQFTTTGAPQRGSSGFISPGIGYNGDPRSGSADRGMPQRQSVFDQAGYDAALAAFNAPQTPNNDPNFGSLTRPFSLADFQESPAYQFNLEQGEAAINKGASARGNYYAPQTLQDLGKFTQGTASNEFQNAFNNYNTNMNNIWNRLYGLSSSGQAAANQTGTFGGQAAEQIGGDIRAGGDARASGIVGAANNILGAGGDAYNAYLQNQVLGQNQRPNYGRTPGGLPGGADY